MCKYILYLNTILFPRLECKQFIRGAVPVSRSAAGDRGSMYSSYYIAFCGLKSFLLKASSEVSCGVTVICFCYLIEFFVKFMNTWLM